MQGKCVHHGLSEEGNPERVCLGWMHPQGSINSWFCLIAGARSRASLGCSTSTSCQHELLRQVICEYWIRSSTLSLALTGPNSLFIRVLLDKKYALPYQVVDGLWSHFVRLANEHKLSKRPEDKLPVLWHQSLLVFCQR